MIAHPGLRFTDHTVTVPLDHRKPGVAGIEIFAREVVAADRVGDDLPWLLFLQGGPGGKSPRPLRADSWLARATRTHRVLLLDQRGTGRSTPITARTVRDMPADRLAAFLRLFRADSIVADAEILRERLAGGSKWDTLGQSYGGFVTMAYLSAAPQGLRNCYVTGGLPGLTATADDVYARTYPRVAAKNAEFYRAFPEDVAGVRAVADHLESADVRLPDGDRLTARRLRLLGNAFGMSSGYAQVHWLFEEAWHGSWLSDTFLHEVMRLTGFVDTPLFALQEYCYGRQGVASGWAASRLISRYPEFGEKADPLLFTGEMMYPWMFAEIAALRPFAGAADLLAAADDWPDLVDVDRLAGNEVPVLAAVYADDMYVDAELSLLTASTVGNVRTWVTNEYEHDGLRTSGDAVLGHLIEMAAGLR
ncbi:pimeloyl-ACP methyl ester carboxylesterase [Actinoplanes lutulentus]|uniref:Pimeloyl-ACP methyl ester carboxylesterase n=1 Tax=Actinoplanes lutulentus TaxID=1287878 RepID=A0A327Z7P9_9ACTN|nr:alpha/beta fold hydrolase [Actinoplanes lutulentus]MBB2943822.1 pimeloyl-ACP methyl ester carboxylesterase [Actinoplanes lutulentus]RAK29364.1 pimeloyl-ACP methyl ester carboxylesterase [Actinoplanes lutulentus]